MGRQGFVLPDAEDAVEAVVDGNSPCTQDCLNEPKRQAQWTSHRFTPAILVPKYTVRRGGSCGTGRCSTNPNLAGERTRT